MARIVQWRLLCQERLLDAIPGVLLYHKLSGFLEDVGGTEAPFLWLAHASPQSSHGGRKPARAPLAVQLDMQPVH